MYLNHEKHIKAYICEVLSCSCSADPHCLSFSVSCLSSAFLSIGTHITLVFMPVSPLLYFSIVNAGWILSFYKLKRHFSLCVHVPFKIYFPYLKELQRDLPPASSLLKCP